MNTLPRGICYDPSHRKHPYRVRLYLNRHVIHLSYHTTLAEAEHALYNARSRRTGLLPPPPQLTSLPHQLDALRAQAL